MGRCDGGREPLCVARGYPAVGIPVPPGFRHSKCARGKSNDLHIEVLPILSILTISALMSHPLSPAKALALVMHDVSRLLRRRVDKAAQTLGLTSAQWRVLAFVSRCEGSNQASMADHMDMEPITLSRHLDRMEAGGVLERRPDPNARRAPRLQPPRRRR